MIVGIQHADIAHRPLWARVAALVCCIRRLFSTLYNRTFDVAV